ncbi:MAG: ABC transporter ATP-binding protein/permease [Lachnospiraceae bacterium]|nr:ABC transporter ATP-binding protein/permease [Lachnospiraceae bacterium]
MLIEIRKVFDAIHKLRFILSPEQKVYCVIVFFMALISAFFELLGISIVIPLLMAIISVDQLKANEMLSPILDFFHLSTDKQIILFLCTCIALIYVAKNAFTILYTWTSAKFANKIRRELSLDIFKAYIAQGYTYFVNNNSSKILRGIGSDPQSVQTIISNMFLLTVRIITVICIVIFIIIQTPEMALVLIVLALFSFSISEIIFKNRLKQSGIEQREYSHMARQASLEAIQGSKEIFVMNRQNYFTDEYLRCMSKYDNACVRQNVGAAAPTNILEAVCVVGVIFVVAFQIFSATDTNLLITKLGTVAVASFRVLPYLGSILGCVNTIIFNAPGLVYAYDTLYEVRELKRKESSPTSDAIINVRFQNEIRMSHITFSYSAEGGKVLNDLDMVIQKGTSVGLIGTSGAGKTTLSDLILALYKPQSGTIQMDGIDINDIGTQWHYITGYVPQSVYLADSSIRRNVAFGIRESEIDDEKVWKALEMAQLKPFVETLKNGLETQVGEWGVKFSGGQRQRIAIARALYSDPDILIMDEATAALDNETEQAVMESIEALQGIKTLIIVAHRLTTIRKCDKIYEIANGKAILRSHEEIFGKEAKH